MEYHYMMSSRKEPKHEISRKEFVKLLGESDHCLETFEIGNTGLGWSIIDDKCYERAEKEIRNAQRRSGNSIWACGSMTLYLERRGK